MLIPNVRFLIKDSNNASAVEIRPRYFEKFFRFIHGGKLVDAGALTIETLEPHLPDSLRYTEVVDEADAYSRLMSFFTSGGITEARLQQYFVQEFPRGLMPVIRELVAKDAEDMAIHIETMEGVPRVAHESFIAAGMGEDAALSLMRKGYEVWSEVPDDIILLTDAGISPPRAALLLRKRTEAQAETKEIAKPRKPRKPKTPPTEEAKPEPSEAFETSDTAK